MKIRLTGLEIIALIVLSMLGISAIFGASVFLAQHGQYYLAMAILFALPSTILMTLVLMIAITRNIE